MAFVDIPVLGANDLGLSPHEVGRGGAMLKRLDYFLPDPGEGAEILEGNREEIIDKLMEMLKSKGGFK